MGETRVDLLHLLEDLRDAYPGSTEETILTEIVANALDSGATSVRIATDPGPATLTIVDDGAGMRRRELARYHDVATSTKARGALAPAATERVGGLIEVPPLAECLTLSKADFIRAGGRGAVYLAYRKGIQEAVRVQLTAWGDGEATSESERRPSTRPLERHLESVLGDLADHFPLLAMLVEHRANGQRRLLTGAAAEPARAAVPVAAVAFVGDVLDADLEAGRQVAAAESPETAATPGPDRAPAASRIPADRTGRRSGRYALTIRFEQRPEDAEPARLMESTVWANDAHPAYRRAVASRSVGYHLALSVAMALAPLVVEPAKEHAFLTAFLVRWGGAGYRRQPS